MPEVPTVVGQRVGSRERLRAYFSLEPNILAAAGAMFAVGLGENLWRRFFPKYLESMGAPVTAIGLYGTAEDFLDGVYQYPGGWVADRYGRRRALSLFIALASVGYLVYWLVPSAGLGWPLAFVGLALVMAWSSMASPALFAVVGDALPREQRTMGFTVQSVLKRVPIVIAPALGGLAVARYGIQGGVRLCLLVSVGFAALALVAASRLTIPIDRDHASVSVRGVWRSFPSPLRWLLASDVFIRTCDAMVDVFLVLFVVNELGLSAPRFGTLVAVQAFTAMVIYVPAARIARRTGKKPFVIATFIAFALFPIAIASSHGYLGLLGAFVIGGLREIGEPARKALIIDLAEPTLRARAVGLYYLTRSLAIAPAAFIGGLLWRTSPALPFYIAGAIGLAGTVVFSATVSEEHAG